MQLDKYSRRPPTTIANSTDLLFSVYYPYLIQRLYAGRESAVNAEDLAVDDRRQREIVKDFGAVTPDRVAAVLAQALVVEAINLSDLPRLVITPN